LVETLDALKLPGIQFSPTSFIPSFQKHSGQSCSGIRLTITDRDAFRSTETGVAVLWALAQQQGFAWRTERYEFVDTIPAIDLLTGSAAIREAIDRRANWSSVQALVGTPPAPFLAAREKCLTT
jgi:uncharacterized protein YbbC (DUF1343 family)